MQRIINVQDDVEYITKQPKNNQKKPTTNTFYKQMKICALNLYSDDANSWWCGKENRKVAEKARSKKNLIIKS